MLKKDRIFLSAVQNAINDFQKGRIKRERFYFIVKQAGLFYKKSYPQVIHLTKKK